MPDSKLANLTNAELIDLHAHVLRELTNRGITRTASSLQGEVGEALALAVYGGLLPPPGTQSVDVIDPRGRRIQVKTRTLPQGVQRVFQFSDLDFDVAICIRFDRSSNDLVWAREYTPHDLQKLTTPHARGPRLPTGIATQSGTDRTASFQAAYQAIRIIVSAV